MAAKVDSHLELTPFLRQPKTLSLEARVDVREFTAEPQNEATAEQQAPGPSMTLVSEEPVVTQEHDMPLIGVLHPHSMMEIMRNEAPKQNKRKMPLPLPESSFLKEAREAMPSAGTSTATRLGSLTSRVEVMREAKQHANEILHEQRCAEILEQREATALQKAGEALAKKEAQKAKKALEKEALKAEARKKREAEAEAKKVAAAAKKEALQEAKKRALEEKKAAAEAKKRALEEKKAVERCSKEAHKS
nr:histone H1, gonadal-like [Aegilops tauschii subsp. strangulata]